MQRRGCQREAAGKCKARFITSGASWKAAAWSHKTSPPPLKKPNPQPPEEIVLESCAVGTGREQKLPATLLPPHSLPVALGKERKCCCCSPADTKQPPTGQHQLSPCSRSQGKKKSSSSREMTSQALGRRPPGRAFGLTLIGAASLSCRGFFPSLSD